jgi:hypothetical protein
MAKKSEKKRGAERREKTHHVGINQSGENDLSANINKLIKTSKRGEIIRRGIKKRRIKKNQEESRRIKKNQEESRRIKKNQE